jgi:hypothetical protein
MSEDFYGGIILLKSNSSGSIVISMLRRAEWSCSYGDLAHAVMYSGESDRQYSDK